MTGLLADRISDKRILDIAARTPGTGRAWLEARTNSFEISNVAHLTKKIEIDDDTYAVKWEQFPNVAPPFMSYWMEWLLEPRDAAMFDSRRVGCWCVCTSETTDDHWSIGISVWAGDREPRPWAVSGLTAAKDGSSVAESSPLNLLRPLHHRDRASTRDPEVDAELVAELDRINDLSDIEERRRQVLALRDRQHHGRRARRSRPRPGSQTRPPGGLPDLADGPLAVVMPERDHRNAHPGPESPKSPGAPAWHPEYTKRWLSPPPATDGAKVARAPGWRSGTGSPLCTS